MDISGQVKKFTETDLTNALRNVGLKVIEKEYVVQKPVFVEKIIEAPKYVEKQIEIPIGFGEVVERLAKQITDEVLMILIPKLNQLLPKEIQVPKIIEREELRLSTRDVEVVNAIIRDQEVINAVVKDKEVINAIVINQPVINAVIEDVKVKSAVIENISVRNAIVTDVPVTNAKIKDVTVEAIHPRWIKPDGTLDQGVK